MATMAIVDEVISPESLPELITQGRYVYKWSRYDSYPEILGKYFKNSIPRNREAFNSSSSVKSLTSTEWKSNIEKWFDYNWDKQHAAMQKQKVPSRIRFELLPTSPETAKQTATTEDVADRDDDPVWMKDDFPVSPWDLYHAKIDASAAERASRKQYEGDWEWNDLTPYMYLGDSGWMYIIDLDFDAFSINAVLHFRLSNMPAGFLEYVDDSVGYVVMPPEIPLPDEHLAWNCCRPQPPVIDQDLIQRYITMQVSITKAPRIVCHPTHLMLLSLQHTLRLYLALDKELMIESERCRPQDRSMQRLVWLFVRYAMWDGLTWKEKEPYHRPSSDGDTFIMALNSRRDLPGMVPMPSTPQYYVFVGIKKILVSLAVNLDIDDVVKMEVAKVVNLTPPGAVQEACIISIKHVVFVTVNKTSPQVSVTRTPVESLALDSDGLAALIATFSSLKTPYEDDLPNNGCFPYEIVETIFEYLALSNDRQTIANFASTCKLFSKIARHRAVAIGGCLTLNFLSQSWQGLLQALDPSGRAKPLALGRLWSVYLLGKTKLWREVMVLADGVHLGLSKVYWWTTDD